MQAFAPSIPLFRPSTRPVSFQPCRVSTTVTRAPPRMVDPSFIDSVHHVTLPALHSLSHLLADAADVAVETKNSGLWHSFVHLVESAVVALHARLSALGVPGPYGFSIILFTVVIKALTFPLNFKQMQSTMKMQALTPRLKKIQADYKDNPTVVNQMTAQLYKEEEINPLAGCLPVFAQIPVWIALYRSVLNLAADNLLNESFLWLPSLQGPVSKTGQGISTWLYPFIDGAPPIGWHDAGCYLILPILLMATQFYSQKLITPPSQDPQQNQANNFLKFMPLLIGWFSLNVPSGLGVYWVTNNLLSTAQTLYIRNKFPDLAAAATAPVEDKTIETEVLQSRTLDAVDGFRSNGTAKTSGSKSSSGSKSPSGSKSSPGSKSSKSSKKKRRKRR